MAQPLRLFVSATLDLEAQRAVIGRTLAELPVDVPAELRRCPVHGVSYETLFELVSSVDRFYFLMGNDITAPAGTEWALALRLERAILPLHCPARLTPAAAHFLREAMQLVDERAWKVFRSDAELARLVGLDLIDLLLHPTNRFGLVPTEIDALLRQRRRWQHPAPAAQTRPGGIGNEAAAGATAGARILGRDDS